MSQKRKIEAARHGHPLPRVRSGSTYVMLGAALVAVLSVIGLSINVALAENSTVTALLITVEIISLLLLIFAALAHRGAKKAILRILTDGQTVHWTYSPTEWQRFSTQAWHRSIRYILKVTGITWGIALGVVLILFATSQGAVDVLVGMAIGTGFALLVGLLLFLRAALILQWRRRQTTLDAYLRPGGFILCGWYYPVNWAVGGIRKITYTAGDPGVLSFDVGTGRGARVLEVPVPQGREAEAERLALSLRFPRA